MQEVDGDHLCLSDIPCVFENKSYLHICKSYYEDSYAPFLLQESS